MKPYRKAFVIHHSPHDFSPLKDLCEQIVFCTNGYETEKTLIPLVRAALSDFDPAKDLIVPAGNVLTNLVAGAIVFSCLHDQILPTEAFNIAVYSDKEYHVIKFEALEMLP